jgi:hypothetical protein
VLTRPGPAACADGGHGDGRGQRHRPHPEDGDRRLADADAGHDAAGTDRGEQRPADRPRLPEVAVDEGRAAEVALLEELPAALFAVVAEAEVGRQPDPHAVGDRAQQPRVVAGEVLDGEQRPEALHRLVEQGARDEQGGGALRVGVEVLGAE